MTNTSRNNGAPSVAASSRNEVSTEAVLPDFEPGTFAPQAASASKLKMIVAQGAMESKLMLRHGEQQLLSIIIPLALLIGFRVFPFSEDLGGLEGAIPMVFAVAATSAGFTGQAIAVAFDRRYGALKRNGASGVPAWLIIVSKIIAVFAMVVLQLVVLGIAAAILGYRAPASGVALALVVLLFGVATFTALGLALGGSMSAEIVLALSNLIWFIMLAIVGWVLYSQGLTDAGWFNVIPSVALASGLAEALEGSFPLIPFISLILWAVGASYIAAKWFRFEG